MPRRRPLSDDDAQLVARAQAGEREAFEELVRRHANHLFAVVVRLVASRGEAEEVTQEAFIRAWRGIGGFKGDAQFFTWLYRIGVNEARRRGQRRAPAIDASIDDPGINPSDPRATPDRQAEHDDLRAALERAVRALEPGYRAPLILRDVEGLSTAEAAAIMGLREAAFKSRLHRARLAVRNAVAAYLDDQD
jgi:RNA polymerase sigma-70 factor (ECF subfamily)